MDLDYYSPACTLDPCVGDAMGEVIPSHAKLLRFLVAMNAMSSTNWNFTPTFSLKRSLSLLKGNMY